MSNPRAVIISDVHYNIHTLALADAATNMALAEAARLEVPLIISGDLHDTKAAMRGECVSAMIKTFSSHRLTTPVYIIPGNHDLLNERSPAHALQFLKPYCSVLDQPVQVRCGMYFIPYQSNPEELKSILKGIPPGSTVICHQGTQGSNMGTYIQDKTAVPIEWFSRFRTISGHYHKHQTVRGNENWWGMEGMFTYVGNPYTLSFGEANDGPKGFCILNEDGTTQQVPTNLRAHRIITLDYTGDRVLQTGAMLRPDDLLWVKVIGPRSKVDNFDKDANGDILFGHSNYKLEKIYTDQPQLEVKTETMTGEQIYDSLIESSGETLDQVATLKALWRKELG